MINIRKSKERGYANRGWLKSYHSFSFSDYYDPNHMNFGTLRVINEDYIASGAGFPTHPHNNMEIITYVINGALEHKDSMGNSSVIKPGEVQRMSAGTGITHSEFNHFKDQETHLLQIWILPEKRDIEPGYEQKSFTEEFKKNNFVLVASKQGNQDSVSINQDANIYVGKFKKGENLEFKVKPQRKIWIQIVKGNLEINDINLHPGDGVAISEESILKLLATNDTEFLLFDLI